MSDLDNPTKPGHEWDGYYRAHNERPPRQQLLDALQLFEEWAGDGSEASALNELRHGNGREGTGSSSSRMIRERRAIDLGCGNGHETNHLLKIGWHVLAIDYQQEAIDRLQARVAVVDLPRLSVLVAPFERLSLPAADLVHAAYSLPFCPPEQFEKLWQAIRKSLEQGGWLVGQLFGPRDTWASNPDMTFHTKEQVEAMLSGWRVEQLWEEESDRPAVSGPKHWHIFHVIAHR